MNDILKKILSQFLNENNVVISSDCVVFEKSCYNFVLEFVHVAKK